MTYLPSSSGLPCSWTQDTGYPSRAWKPGTWRGSHGRVRCSMCPKRVPKEGTQFSRSWGVLTTEKSWQKQLPLWRLPQKTHECICHVHSQITEVIANSLLWIEKQASLVKPEELHTGPCMWAARAQKLAWSTQHSLLMTAGQAQIQIITASTTKPALSKHAGLIQTQEHLPCSIHVGKAHPILFQVRCGRNNKKITVIPTWLWSSCPGEKN